MKERGFTLIEVMVALSIFSIVSAGMLPAFLTYLKYNVNAQVKTEAALAAQEVLDEKRVEDPSDMPTSGSDPAQTVLIGNHSFDVTVSYCENTAYCAIDTRHLAVDVTYKGEVIYALETVYTDLR